MRSIKHHSVVCIGICYWCAMTNMRSIYHPADDIAGIARRQPMTIQ